MFGDNGDLVVGNYVGTNVSGTSPIGNGPISGGSGLTMENAEHCTIGGAEAGAGNLIGGNDGNGIYILDGDASDNLIEGNFIGTDPTGTLQLTNSVGIFINNGSGGNTIGGVTSVPGTARATSSPITPTKASRSVTTASAT